jgi:outer membrane protein assembly factor BamB
MADELDCRRLFDTLGVRSTRGSDCQLNKKARKVIRILLISAWLVAAAPPAPVVSQLTKSPSQTTWPAFRGTGQSLTTASDLPTEWSDDQNVAWATDLPGYGQSSPVIWGDRVFVTTMQGDMKETPTILCLDLNDGRILWKKEFQGTQEVEASNYVTRSAPTPAVDAQHCFAFFESGELIATDHDGNVRWQRSLVDEYGEFQGNHGIGSSLAINDQYIFVLVAHEGPSYLMAVDKSNGKNIWKTELDEQVAWSSPIVADKQILLSVSGTVSGFAAETGKRIWSIDEVEGNTVASVIVHEDVAFVGSSKKSHNFAIQFDATAKTVPIGSRILYFRQRPAQGSTSRSHSFLPSKVTSLNCACT